MNSNYKIAAYYFPNFHLDPRNEAWHGKGWTEWNLVRAAAPRFEGHVQPKVPAWGYEDESDPAVMAKKIGAAARSGLSAFLFDWYWYDNGPYLQRAGGGLSEGGKPRGSEIRPDVGQPRLAGHPSGPAEPPLQRAGHGKGLGPAV